MENKTGLSVGLTLLIVGVLLLATPLPLMGDTQPAESQTQVLFSKLVGDELVLGEQVFAIHGDLEDRALYLDDQPVQLNGAVPWWVSCLEFEGSIHMVVGDAAYRTFLSQYYISEDGGESWMNAESFWGYLKPHITAVDGTIYIMFERSLDMEDASYFKLIDGQFERIKGEYPFTYAEVLDYRTTEEYAAYDVARKNEVEGRPADTAKVGRAPEKPWTYIYVCNGEAAGIEGFLEADAIEMAAGGSSANHWSVCLFDDDGAGPNEVRVMDEGGGGGYTIYTMADLGLPSEPDLNEPNTYIIFLEWCFVNYPGTRVV